MKRVRANIFAVEKKYVLHVVNECVALVNQNAMRVRNIVICGLPGSTIFFHNLRNSTILKSDIEFKMCVLIVSATLPEIFFILRGIERDMIINVYWS
jgi:hypothetical protein